MSGETWIAIYFITGACWAAFRLGYAEDKVTTAGLLPFLWIIWPLDIFYGLGLAFRIWVRT